MRLTKQTGHRGSSRSDGGFGRSIGGGGGGAGPELRRHFFFSILSLSNTHHSPKCVRKLKEIWLVLALLSLAVVGSKVKDFF